MFDSSRRRFLLDGSKFTAASILLRPSLTALAMRSRTSSDTAPIPVVSLDQVWRFSRGPRTIDEVWRTGGQQDWKAVQLPHCFNAEDACDPDHAYFRGQGWYAAHLRIDNPFPEGRTLLHLDGAGQTTTVWAASQPVGKHTGGYDEFAFDVTDAVHSFGTARAAEGVPFAVCCDNSPDRERIPSDMSDFCLYGGMYRHARLIYLPAVALDTVHVAPSVSGDGAAEIAVKVRLYNPGRHSTPCRLTMEILDADGAILHRQDRTIPSWDDFAESGRFQMQRPQLWSPDTPYLYRCRVSLSTAFGEMTAEERFGIRHFEFVEHGPFLMNGKRLLLRGTQRHADHAGVAAAMTDDMVRTEMKLIRDMGANFIRLAHYQQDRLVLDLCDELGLLVWEELPWCRSGVGDEVFQHNAKAMLTHMIEQHYNHPSVILWGLGNEVDWPDEYPGVDEAAIRGFLTELRDQAHTLDSSRLTAFRRCDFARDIPDVYSPSIWAGWYRGDYHEYEHSLTAQHLRVKRMIHIEWGADSLRGRHSEDPEAVLREVARGNGTDERGFDYLREGGEPRVSRDGDWSETYACRLFDWYLKTQEKLDWFTGSAQWIFKDFASPLREDSSIPRVNVKGVVERDLTLKESYFVFQSYWAQRPMVHIYGHTWPIRWGAAGEKRTVCVYSNCERVELFLNGASLGIRTRHSQDFPAAGLRWQVPFAKGLNRLRAVAHKGPEQVADEITLQYQTERWGTPSSLRMHTSGHNSGVVTVEVTLLDAQGVPCLDASRHIRFSLAGAGRLIDNLGTSGGSRALELANGRAQISVTCREPCVLTASVAGVPDVQIQIS